MKSKAIISSVKNPNSKINLNLPKPEVKSFTNVKSKDDIIYKDSKPFKKPEISVCSRIDEKKLPQSESNETMNCKILQDFDFKPVIITHKKKLKLEVIEAGKIPEGTIILIDENGYSKSKRKEKDGIVYFGTESPHVIYIIQYRKMKF